VRKPITIRQQRTLFQPCCLCGEHTASGSTLVAETSRGIVPVPRELRVACGIVVAQQRLRELCASCMEYGAFEVATIAERLRGAA
jgi:hypothetical protein